MCSVIRTVSGGDHEGVGRRGVGGGGGGGQSLAKEGKNVSLNSHVYSKTSMTRTLMARLLWLIRTRF